MKKQNVDLIAALAELEQTKGISKDLIFEALESALLSACKKNYPNNTHFKVEIDRETGAMHTFVQKEIVDSEETDDPYNTIPLKEALAITPAAEVGGLIDYPVQPQSFAHTAMQTAKQIISQKVTQAEHDKIYDRYIDYENQILTAMVQKVDKKGVLMVLDSGVEAFMLQKETVPTDGYRQGMRLKCYVLEVAESTTKQRDAQIQLSRRHPGLIKCLFEQEVPEISDGLVTIKAIARDPGLRSKIAVEASNDMIDPVGTCVGVGGSRINHVTDALGDERIDVIRYSDDIAEFASAALSPAKVTLAEVDEENKTVFVKVPKNQLSLAIGKNAQNVRLAVRLTGWKIDIKPDTEFSS